MDETNPQGTENKQEGLRILIGEARGIVKGA